MKVRKQYNVKICTTGHDFWMQQLASTSFLYQTRRLFFSCLTEHDEGPNVLILVYRKPCFVDELFDITDHLEKIPELSFQTMDFTCYRLKELTEKNILSRLNWMLRPNWLPITSLEGYNPQRITKSRLFVAGARNSYWARKQVLMFLGLEKHPKRYCCATPYRDSWPIGNVT